MHFNFAVQEKKCISRHFNFAVQEKKCIIGHFNFAAAKIERKKLFFLTINFNKYSSLQIRTSHGFKFSTLFSLINCFLLSIRQDFYVFLQRNQKTDFFSCILILRLSKITFFAAFNFAVFRPHTMKFSCNKVCQKTLKINRLHGLNQHNLIIL